MRNFTKTDTIKVLFGFSVVASLVATISASALDLPVWATFIGWIAFFSRGGTFRDGLINLACVLIGIVIGIAAGAASGVMMLYLGEWTLTLTVLLATFLLLCIGSLPGINNLTSLFLGLVCYFASHKAPTLETFGILAASAVLGVTGGFVASLVKTWITRSKTDVAPV